MGNARIKMNIFGYAIDCRNICAIFREDFYITGRHDREWNQSVSIPGILAIYRLATLNNRMSDNKRRHDRIKHFAKIRVLPPPGKAVIVNMRDFSESGLFLVYKDAPFVSVGDIVEVNTMEFEGAPVQKCKVIRVEPEQGFAVEFLEITP